MMSAQSERKVTRWVDVVENQQRLSPAEYRAFRLAIGQVKERLHQVLARPLPQRQGQFELDGFVDSLHDDFLTRDGNGTANDVGQTAWWVTRYLADKLLELQQLEKLRR